LRVAVPIEHEIIPDWNKPPMAVRIGVPQVSAKEDK
jgi:hypothetical protein